MTDSMRYGVAAALLAQSRTIHAMSVCLSVGAAVIAALAMLNHETTASAIAAMAIVFGLAECWFAVRAGFDAALFTQLRDMALSAAEPLAELDDTLSDLKLISDDKRGRPLKERLSGAFRLLRIQGVLSVAQAAGLYASLIAIGWR